MVFALISLTGTASGHLVNLSIAVKQYWYPRDGGKGPTMYVMEPVVWN